MSYSHSFPYPTPRPFVPHPTLGAGTREPFILFDQLLYPVLNLLCPYSLLWHRLFPYLAPRHLSSSWHLVALIDALPLLSSFCRLPGLEIIFSLALLFPSPVVVQLDVIALKYRSRSPCQSLWFIYVRRVSNRRLYQYLFWSVLEH